MGTIGKRSGGVRLLEKPKEDLKRMQRFVLHGILDRVRGSDFSHGFRQGRSIFSYVEPHVGRGCVVKFDLRDYFLSVGRARVRSVFHLAGYPPKVSDALAGLCTHRLARGDVPRGVVSGWRCEGGHLPQGAPTSPALADRVLFLLDQRLGGLAEKMGMRYSRYADDLAFSTDEEFGGERVVRFRELVGEIVRDEGFEVNGGKTRVMYASGRQRLAGLVVNGGTNLAREEYDRLRAILYRCGVNGVEAENREGRDDFLEHLRGRVGFVKCGNLERGERLEGMIRGLVG